MTEEERGNDAYASDLAAWRQKVAEANKRRCELEKNPPKPAYIRQLELRRKVDQVEKARKERNKSPPLCDYDRSLEKSIKGYKRQERAQRK